jgi:hypothetical protein
MSKSLLLPESAKNKKLLSFTAGQITRLAALQKHLIASKTPFPSKEQPAPTNKAKPPLALHAAAQDCPPAQAPDAHLHPLVQKSLTSMLCIKNKLSMAYHPQTDGQTECVNQILEKYLRFFVNHHQDN